MEVNAQMLGVSHPYIGYLHTPHNTGILQSKDFQATYHTDGHGFRNTWPWPEAADIVVVGDSFVFGYGVEDNETWPAILAQAPPQYRLLNLGLIGAGPEQYRRVYQTFGIQMRPKVLLVGMLMDNDLWDMEMFDRWLALGGKGNYMVWRSYGRYVFTLQEPLNGLKNLGRRYSYLYNLMQNAYKTLRWGRPHLLPFADGTQVQLLPSRLGEIVAMAQPHSSQFHLVLKALTRLHSLATECGTHVLVIFQPSKEEVYLPLLGEPTPDPGAPIREALDSRGIEFLDLTPAFRQQAQVGQRLFFEIDGHLNRAGYRLIASEVLQHLKKNAATYDLHAIAVE
jgi:lysophospholipase L1-like esterase